MMLFAIIIVLFLLIIHTLTFYLLNKPATEYSFSNKNHELGPLIRAPPISGGNSASLHCNGIAQYSNYPEYPIMAAKQDGKPINIRPTIDAATLAKLDRLPSARDESTTSIPTDMLDTIMKIVMGTVSPDYEEKLIHYFMADPNTQITVGFSVTSPTNSGSDGVTNPVVPPQHVFYVKKIDVLPRQAVYNILYHLSLLLSIESIMHNKYYVADLFSKLDKKVESIVNNNQSNAVGGGSNADSNQQNSFYRGNATGDSKRAATPSIIITVYCERRPQHFDAGTIKLVKEYSGETIKTNNTFNYGDIVLTSNNHFSTVVIAKMLLNNDSIKYMRIHDIDGFNSYDFIRVRNDFNSILNFLYSNYGLDELESIVCTRLDIVLGLIFPRQTHFFTLKNINPDKLGQIGILDAIAPTTTAAIAPTTTAIAPTTNSVVKTESPLRFGYFYGIKFIAIEDYHLVIDMNKSSNIAAVTVINGLLAKQTKIKKLPQAVVLDRLAPAKKDKIVSYLKPKED